MKAIKAYEVDIVNSTDDTDGDWINLLDYRRLLKALGRLRKDRGVPAKRPRTTADGENSRRVKYKPDFNENDTTVVIKKY